MTSGTSARPRVFVVGAYATDMVFSLDHIPISGETVSTAQFMRGHGGKASNQAVAAARAGADVLFFTLLGDDAFGREASAFWAREGIQSLARVVQGHGTGVAAILLDGGSGANAIAIHPGACLTMGAHDVRALAPIIASASVLVAQLEQPLEVALEGLELARAQGVTTLLNPAPARELPPRLFPLCDYIVPNEREASLLTGLPVENARQAEAAARSLLGRGARAVIVTLGAGGSLFCTADVCFVMPACHVGACVDTTGAGDAYTGGLAAALAEGLDAARAMQFASVVAGISVTRPGAALSMPLRREIDAACRRHASSLVPVYSAPQ